MTINKKSKLKQLFCRHKNTGWYEEQNMFQRISGETHYKICKDCGKQLAERNLQYEGMGFK